MKNQKMSLVSFKDIYNVLRRSRTWKLPLIEGDNSDSITPWRVIQRCVNMSEETGLDFTKDLVLTNLIDGKGGQIVITLYQAMTSSFDQESKIWSIQLDDFTYTVVLDNYKDEPVVEFYYDDDEEEDENVDIDDVFLKAISLQKQVEEAKSCEYLATPASKVSTINSPIFIDEDKVKELANQDLDHEMLSYLIFGRGKFVGGDFTAEYPKHEGSGFTLTFYNILEAKYSENSKTLEMQSHLEGFIMKIKLS